MINYLCRCTNINIESSIDTKNEIEAAKIAQCVQRMQSLLDSALNNQATSSMATNFSINTDNSSTSTNNTCTINSNNTTTNSDMNNNYNKELHSLIEDKFISSKIETPHSNRNYFYLKEDKIVLQNNQ
jgi:hypothetical protein